MHSKIRGEDVRKRQEPVSTVVVDRRTANWMWVAVPSKTAAVSPTTRQYVRSAKSQLIVEWYGYAKVHDWTAIWCKTRTRVQLSS